MTDLNELLRDFKDKRLAYKEINRAAHEALLDGIVAEVTAQTVVIDELSKQLFSHPTFMDGAWHRMVADIEALKEKRGPGRPPKPSEALNG